MTANPHEPRLDLYGPTAARGQKQQPDDAWTGDAWTFCEQPGRHLTADARWLQLIEDLHRLQDAEGLTEKERVHVCAARTVLECRCARARTAAASNSKKSYGDSSAPGILEEQYACPQAEGERKMVNLLLQTPQHSASQRSAVARQQEHEGELARQVAKRETARRRVERERPDRRRRAIGFTFILLAALLAASAGTIFLRPPLLASLAVMGWLTCVLCWQVGSLVRIRHGSSGAAYFKKEAFNAETFARWSRDVAAAPRQR